MRATGTFGALAMHEDELNARARGATALERTPRPNIVEVVVWSWVMDNF